MNLLTIILLAFTAISHFGARAMSGPDTVDSSCAWSTCGKGPCPPDSLTEKIRRCTLEDGSAEVQSLCCGNLQRGANRGRE
ncbi:uncharacterized protein EDB91DRAFT_1124353 [Suillus paluster]|uniref:uncharacterized protein n=1 Tax=Suillus paluster TaxID=48578 RepID=UPI001B86FE90|nr:uncharacterized protein EDB91DRAFT_1124353 [Suillus paluster]KAG1744055.1 hypothetical protein EDB91DRAFT_1124353 [Suillus paluster]